MSEATQVQETATKAPDIEAEVIKEVLVQARGKRGPKPGRPRKMTFRRLRYIMRQLRNGVPDSVAAQAAGIDPSTWSDWKGEFPQLSRLASRAANRGFSEIITELRHGVDVKGQPDWRARLAIAERRVKEFTPPKAVEINNNVQHNTLNVAADPSMLAAMAQAHALAAQALAGTAQPLALDTPSQS